MRNGTVYGYVLKPNMITKTQYLVNVSTNISDRAKYEWTEENPGRQVKSRQYRKRVLDRYPICIQLGTGEVFYNDWNEPKEIVATKAVTRLLALTLVDHRTNGDSIIKGLKARGINVQDTKIVENYLGGWTITIAGQECPAGKFVEYIHGATAE